MTFVHVHPGVGRSRLQRGLLVAPDRVRGGIARNAQILAFIEPCLILAMERRAAARLAQDRRDAFVFRDQQRAGRRSHENLDSGGARQALQLRNEFDVVRRAADPEREIAMHAMRRALDLVGQRLGRGRQWIGVRHLEHGRDAAERGPARPRLQILLMVSPGSRKCTCVSMTPGRMVRPPASMVSPALARERSPMETILPARTPMSRTPTPL